MYFDGDYDVIDGNGDDRDGNNDHDYDHHRNDHDGEIWIENFHVSSYAHDLLYVYAKVLL